MRSTSVAPPDPPRPLERPVERVVAYEGVAGTVTFRVLDSAGRPIFEGTCPRWAWCEDTRGTAEAWGERMEQLRDGTPPGERAGRPSAG